MLTYNPTIIWLIISSIPFLLIATSVIIFWLSKRETVKKTSKTESSAHFHQHNGVAFLHAHPGGDETHTHTHVNIPIEQYVNYLKHYRSAQPDDQKPPQ